MEKITQENEKHKGKFIKFLKQQHAYEQFIFNFKKYNKTANMRQFMKNTLPSLFIFLAFDWTTTNEGSYKWGILDAKWTDIIRYKP